VNPEHVWFRGLPAGGAKVERLELAFTRLPSDLMGMRLLFASDVHAGITFPDAAQEQLIAQIAGLAPDMILWGGDFAESRADAKRLFARIAHLKPRLGMAAVVGNNDRRAFHGSMDDLKRLSERAGVRMLINERWTLPGGALTILGLDEDYYGSPDASILNATKNSGDLTILLSHSPTPLMRLLDGRTPPDLILSGHTHGGQMRLFGLTMYDLGFDRVHGRRQRYFTVRGVRQDAGTTLVVSGGLGSSKIPLRINCPPEMQLITLSKD
jgi:uncharacterized protein